MCALPIFLVQPAAWQVVGSDPALALRFDEVPGFGTRYSVLGTRDSGLGTRDSGLGTRDSGLGTTILPDFALSFCCGFSESPVPSPQSRLQRAPASTHFNAL